MSAPDYSLVVQGSPEWLQIRLGIVTGSRAADVIAAKKNGEEKAERRQYRTELICEILTGQPYPQHVTREMQWGIDQEQFARAAYELKFHVDVDQVGFVMHPDIARFGCSPDGLVGDEGMIQIKCPTTATHVDYWRAGVVPIEHCTQMLAELSCTGREWCDFVSYDPRLPEHLQLFVRRFARNQNLIDLLETEVVHFNAEIDEVLGTLPQPPRIAEILDWPAADEAEF